MTGQTKRYKMVLEHGAELVGPVGAWTAATMQVTSDYDSSKPLEAAKAAADCFAQLVNEFSENATSVPRALREQFVAELISRLKYR